MGNLLATAGAVAVPVKDLIGHQAIGDDGFLGSKDNYQKIKCLVMTTRPWG